MQKRAWMAVLAVALGSCAPNRSVLVQLVSNMSPGREIDRVSVVMTGGGAGPRTANVTLDATTSLGRPTRIASFIGLEAGHYDIAITLDRGATTVQNRHVVRDVDGTVIVTVLMTRECNGVMCPGSGAPSDDACLGGRCVAPTCDEEHPELCASPECHVDADCAASPIACAPARCSSSGACFARPDDERCSSGQLCDALLGCVPAGSDAGPSPSDAGMDAGSDAGRDAGHDAGAVVGTDASHDAGHDANPDASGCAIGGHFTGGGCHDFLDVNGDGIGDLVVGASTEGMGGIAYLYRGSATGPVLAGSITSMTVNERVGLAVANAHDTNGDGRDDVLISAHNAGPGHAYLVLGRATVPAALPVDVTLAATGSAEFGQFMAGVGDVNGDGLADAVVSEDGRSQAHLFLGHMGSGLSAAPDQSIHPPDLFGTFAIGDINGDGADDVAFPGALLSNEHVYLFLATAGRFNGTTPGGTLLCDDGANQGFGVLARADVTGDGHVDIVVGASADGTGRIFVFVGRPGGVPPSSIASTMEGATGLGSALTGLGDIDGDGFEDIAAAADVAGTANVVIMRGSAGGLLTPGSVFTLPAGAGRTRIALTAADLTGDGVVDLVVGDPVRAHTYVIRGPLTAASLTTTYDLSRPAGSNYGGAVAAR